MRLISLSVVAVLVLVTGCTSVQQKSISSKILNRPKDGYVDVAAVEAVDPRMPILISLNLAITLSGRYQTIGGIQPENLDVRSYMQRVSTLGTVDVRQGLEAEQKKRLGAITEDILDGLNKRLLAAEDLSIEAQRIEQLALGRSQLANAAENLQNEANIQTRQYTADAGQITSLKMQIAAMKLDETPPPTAPKGYWLSIETQKEEELSKLLTEYDAHLQSIYDNRDQQVEREKETISRTIDAQLADLRNSSEQSRLLSLAEARERFDRQESELDTEDRQVLSEAQKVLSNQGGDLNAVSNIGLTEAPQDSSQHGMAALLQYRTALQKKIVADSEYSIISISRKLNVRVVEEGQGVSNLTPIFVQAVKDQNWKVT